MVFDLVCSLPVLDSDRKGIGAIWDKRNISTWIIGTNIMMANIIIITTNEQMSGTEGVVVVLEAVFTSYDTRSYY